MKKLRDLAIFHIADLHIGSCRQVYDYMNRVRVMCSSITDIVINHTAKRKVVVIAGDLFDRKALTEEERNQGIEFVVNLIRNGIHVVMILGNHDYVDEQGTTMLDGFHHIKQLDMKHLHVITRAPDVVDLSDFGVSFLCVPCKQNLTTKKLGRILSELRSKAKNSLCYAVVHEAVSGSLAKDNFVLKTDCELPDVINIEGILLGDIHIRQKIGKSAWYCGSPYQTKYNDTKDKGILVWTPGVEDPEIVLLKSVPRLIEIDDPKKLKKYENTKHAVRYIGSEPVDTDAVNVTTIRNMKALVRSHPNAEVEEAVEKVRHSALVGLSDFLKKDGLSDSEVEEGFNEAELEVVK